MFSRMAKILFSLVVCSGVAALLAACAGEGDVRTLNEVEPTGTEFSKFLTEEYRILANREWGEMYDYNDAAYFARKGIEASKGLPPFPEELEKWSISDIYKDELDNARKRMLIHFFKGARIRAPKAAAVAQARFDCWVEQQSEDFKPGHVLQCRKDFETAMKQLDKIMTQPESYIVNFPSGGMKIDEDGMKAIKDALADAKKRDYLQSITVIGHTDAAGDAEENVKLSERRANAVKAQLIKMGVPADGIEIVGAGESSPITPTADGVSEPSNRRAEIRLF